MEQSAVMLTIQRYTDSLETVAAGVCENWLLPEVDPHGHPVRKNQPAAPDPELLEEQFTGQLAEETRRSYDAGYEAGYKTGYEQGSQEGATAERGTQRVAHAEKLQRLADEIGSIT
jgi:flagellar biosynthesis/type III secretory pathway protein FliH